MTDERRDGYLPIAEAAERRVRYGQFDSEVQSGLSLFALREDIDFALLEMILDRVIAYLPSIKRIFSLPIIRLRDSGEILPAEAVRVVNSKTLSHISVHSELWSNIKGDTLIPRKLMSIRQDDDYAIYENIVFAKTVDLILAFTAKNSRALRDMLYANREMRFNLLERENHPSYFLALGKLHTGYLRDYDKYLLPIERCFEKLTAVEHALIPRLKMPVYQKCRGKAKKLTLKKTNIFRSHKDYRRLYTLAKFFSEIGIEQVLLPEQGTAREDYFAYCTMLCVFAAGHFNFKFDPEAEIDWKNIDLNAAFGGFSLNIKRREGALELTVGKDTVYKIALCPYERVETDADEVIRVDPNGETGLRLGIYDIDSFRRVQQLLLRAMIYADGEHRDCPFCGRGLEKTEEGFECGACRTVISEHVCPETGERYFATSIKHFKKQKNYHRAPEAICYYRNITAIDEGGENICPRCGQIHKKS